MKDEIVIEEYERENALRLAYEDWDSEETPVNMMGAVRAFGLFMRHLGMNPVGHPHLHETPGRVAEMYADLLGGGKDFSFTTFENKHYGEGTPELILVRSIPFVSFCAHHFLPFIGTADIGYVPGKRIVGLSKLARTLAAVSAKPQVQEELTEQVADMLTDMLEPEGVGVVLRARHSCMEIRGPKAIGSETVTKAFRGSMYERDSPHRQEMTL